MRKMHLGFLFVLVLCLFIMPMAAYATVSDVSVDVDPLTAGTAAAYSIDFTTGAEGALVGGEDTITVTFPSGTTVPSSISTSRIQVNDTAPKAVTCSTSNRTVRITLNDSQAIEAGAAVTVDIASAANIKNPSSTGTYSLTVETSKEDAAVESNDYEIISKVSNFNVTPSTTSPGVAVQYDVVFKTSSAGALSSGDYIYLQFPSAYTLPSSISTSRIEVNNYNPSAVTVDSTSDPEVIAIRLSRSISSSTTVTVDIASAANIKNPTTEGTYQISLYTEKDTVPATDSVTITQSITQAAVTLGSYQANVATQWTAKFYVSADGALTGGTDSITLKFPAEAYLPSSISESNITVNGSAVADVTVDRAADTVTMIMPTSKSVADNGLVTVIIKSGAGVRTPSDAGTYYMYASTSEDTPLVRSGAITITEAAITDLDVDLSTYAAGEYSDIDMTFYLSSNGALNGTTDTITIEFPSAFDLPSGTLTKSYMTVNGRAVYDYDLYTSRLDLTVPVDISSGAKVTVHLDDALKIRNPLSSGDYTLVVYTSQDPTEVTSNELTISGAAPTVTLSNSGVNMNAQYTIGFYTEASAPLSYGDTIRVRFPSGTSVPGSISTSNVTVNGLRPASVTVSGYSVTIRMPDTLTINSGAKATIVFNTGAGIYNPSSAGTYNLYILSSEESAERKSAAYTIASSRVVTLIIGNTRATIDGQVYTLDAAPTIINNYTVVPIRFVGDALGAKTTWDPVTRSVRVEYNSKVIIFLIDIKTAIVDGAPVTLDVPATIINSRTMIPIRFISESYGAKVDWNSATRQVTITR
jgi:hypothetical protein